MTERCDHAVHALDLNDFRSPAARCTLDAGHDGYHRGEFPRSQMSESAIETYTRPQPTGGEWVFSWVSNLPSMRDWAANRDISKLHEENWIYSVVDG